MKKIIPFKKDIIFKTNLAEITSISLENTLKQEEGNLITGTFIVSGEYKVSNESINVDKFSYELPFDIHMDSKYLLNRCSIDIDDFYYEIINSQILSVNIDVAIDKIEETLEKLEPVELVREDILDNDFMLSEDNKVEKRCVEEEDVKPKEERNLNSLFDNIDDSIETYKCYKVYIVRDGDDIELICEKYNTTKELLEMYNDISSIKIGDKIIIPANEVA